MLNLNFLPITLDEDVTFSKEYYEKTAIKNMENFHVTGTIKYNLSDEIEIDVYVKGNLYLEDAITLENIKYPIDLHINEILDETTAENGKYFEKSKNILDKLEFLWENIVLEVPISFTKQSGITMSGEGWELNKKDEEKAIDPRLAKLNDLFKGGE